jgi:stage II sporulation protein P
MRKLVENILGFDIEKPESIINSNIVLLSDYYPAYESNKLKRLDDNVKKALNTPGTSPSPSGVVSETPAPGSDIVTNDSETGVHRETDTGETNNATPPAVPAEEKTESYGKVAIQQLEGTNYKLDIEALLKEPLKLKNNKSGPQVLIYHTHTTEAYLKSISELGSDLPSRLTDQRYNVLAVGDELAKLLKQDGIGVIHNGTNHLAQGDIGAYGRSLETITNIIKGNPSIVMTLDIHRDGYGEGKKLRSVVDIKGKSAAKIMFVVGTNYNLQHPNWKENLKLALRLQKYLEDNYPGITRPIYISSNRYNEHVTNGSLIAEVGGDGNTISEATESMKYLANAIYEVLK